MINIEKVIKMNFQRKTPDIEQVFNQRWQANNYRLNGIKDKIQNEKDAFNRINNIKPKEEIRKEVLEANSINGRLKRLNESIAAAKGNRNNFN